MNKILIIAGVAICSLTTFGQAQAQAREVLISGETMGTTYHVKVVAGAFDHIGSLEEKIIRRLAQINRSMSTYLEDSEISRFNRGLAAGEKFPVSADFLQVMAVAQQLYRLTGGAWDGTVKPVVDLWGFGSGKAAPGVPSAASIHALLDHIGFDKLEVFPDGFLVKKDARVTLDLASIAKGFAVDQVAAVVAGAGFENFLVEIGGEVYAAGRRPDGNKWRIGINSPRKDAPTDAVYQVVALQDQGFATSGDYRNFFERDGVRYSHVIDPRTGRPVANRVVSVSVQADTCTLADGLATAVMVMGARAGIDLIDGMAHVSCLIIVEEAGGRLRNYASRGFLSEASEPAPE